MNATAYLRFQGMLVDRRRLSTEADGPRVLALPGGAPVPLGGPGLPVALGPWSELTRTEPCVARFETTGITLDVPAASHVTINGEDVAAGRAALVPSDSIELAGLLAFVHEEPPLELGHDVEAWLEATRSPRRDARWSAFQMLGTLAPARPEVRAACRTGARDPEARVARWAAWALGLAAPGSLYLEMTWPVIDGLPRLEVPPIAAP